MSSTAVSSTTSSSSAAPTSQCAASLYDTPEGNNDIVCAVPYKEEYIGYMKTCCKGADVVSYYNNCGLYCLVIDQTVQQFQECMWKDDKVPTQFPFCSGNGTDTATGTKAEIPASVTASIIGGSSSSSTGTNTASSATGTSTSGSSSNDKGAAATFGISKMAAAVGTLLFATFIVA